MRAENRATLDLGPGSRDHGRMRTRLVLALVTTLLALGGCVNRSRGPVFGRPTGTCAGACDHYLWCKAQYGDKVDERSRQTCELECPEVFSGAESLAAFESLTCDDTVAFVEGESGRGPGALLSDTPVSTAPDTKPSGAEPPGAEPRSSHPPGPEAP
jgi:hypothetical protein